MFTPKTNVNYMFSSGFRKQLRMTEYYSISKVYTDAIIYLHNDSFLKTFYYRLSYSVSWCNILWYGIFDTPIDWMSFTVLISAKQTNKQTNKQTKHLKHVFTKW